MTALVGLYLAVTYEGMFGLPHSVLWKPAPDSLTTHAAVANFNLVGLRAISLWGLTWLVFRQVPAATPLPAAARLENRAIAAGLCLVLAYYAFEYPVRNLVQPVREIEPGVWSTDAKRARLVVSPEAVNFTCEADEA